MSRAAEPSLERLEPGSRAEAVGAERGDGSGAPRKLKAIDRGQRTWAAIDVEEMIGVDHKARAIWELSGRLKLELFEQSIRSQEGEKGAAAWPPRLLLSVWVYALSEGVRKAREIERLMEYEPGLRWLSGLQVINHHTLSDFLSGNRQAVEQVFVEMLAVLEQGGVVDLGRVMHDGTKIRAQAGADSFRREATIRKRLERAHEVVQQIGDPESEEREPRRRAARQRAAREQVERLEEALRELDRLREQNPSRPAEEVRVSISEPQARVMQHADRAIAPSYNAQISTDAKNQVIVAVEVTQAGSDFEQLQPALKKIEEQLRRKPAQVVVDGGYTSEANIEAISEQGIDLIGPVGDENQGRSRAALKRAGIEEKLGPQHFVRQPDHTVICPAGKRLEWERSSVKHGKRYEQYRAAGADCAQCGMNRGCCPKDPARGRLVSIRVYSPAVQAFRDKMQTAPAKTIYKQRGAVAEFPNACIKERMGLRKFLLRGLVKVNLEATWNCLAFNAAQWIRLCWRPVPV